MVRRAFVSTLAAFVSFVCLLSMGASSAAAVEWAHHIGIGGGGNAFGPFVRLDASETVGYGSGLGCAGIRGISGVVCETTPGEFVSVVLGSYVSSEPYIHNHSTFESFFNGYYY
jgi:hypothetical protein